jgi:hypothetical protein
MKQKAIKHKKIVLRKIENGKGGWKVEIGKPDSNFQFLIFNL